MGGMSYADQVRMFFDSDIVLGGHGTAMTNCMFLLPHSVLIECNPPFFYEMCFANIAFLSRAHYISVTTYESKTLSQSRAVRAYERGYFFSMRREYAQSAVHPSLNLVYNAVVDGIAYVRRWKYSLKGVDNWSPVFN